MVISCSGDGFRSVEWFSVDHCAVRWWFLLYPEEWANGLCRNASGSHAQGADQHNLRFHCFSTLDSIPKQEWDCLCWSGYGPGPWPVDKWNEMGKTNHEKQKNCTSIGLFVGSMNTAAAGMTLLDDATYINENRTKHCRKSKQFHNISDNLADLIPVFPRSKSKEVGVAAFCGVSCWSVAGAMMSWIAVVAAAMDLPLPIRSAMVLLRHICSSVHICSRFFGGWVAVAE